MVPNGDNASVSPSVLPELCPNCSASSSSSDPPGVDVTKAVVLAVVLGVFVVFGVLGNILVILSVACHRHLRSVAHYFIANLAAADLLLSAGVLPFSAASEALGRWVFGRALCSAWAALDVLCCTASILSLCAIAVDRCLAVSYPLRYPALATERRGAAAVVALWGLSAAISVGPLFGWRQEDDPEDETVCRITEEPGYAIFSALGSFYVPLAVILAAYCRVYVVASSQRRTRGLAVAGGGRKRQSVQSEGVTLRIHRGNAAAAEEEDEEGSGGRATNKQRMRRKCTDFGPMRLLRFTREKKAAKTLGIVVGCFILCWLPFFLVLPIGSMFPRYRPSDTIFKITFWLGYFNSCLNPIIYPCFSQEFKKAFLNVLRCRRRCYRRGGGGGGGGAGGGPAPQSVQVQLAYSSNAGGGGGVTPRATPPPPRPSCSSSSDGQEDPSFSCSCCGTLSQSSPSVPSDPPPARSRQSAQDPPARSHPSGQDLPTRSHPSACRVQSKSLLKAWCFAGRKTRREGSSSSPPPQKEHSSSNGTRKTLRLSLGPPGDAV